MLIVVLVSLMLLFAAPRIKFTMQYMVICQKECVIILGISYFFYVLNVFYTRWVFEFLGYFFVWGAIILFYIKPPNLPTGVVLTSEDVEHLQVGIVVFQQIVFNGVMICITYNLFHYAADAPAYFLSADPDLILKAGKMTIPSMHVPVVFWEYDIKHDDAYLDFKHSLVNIFNADSDHYLWKNDTSREKYSIICWYAETAGKALDFQHRAAGVEFDNLTWVLAEADLRSIKVDGTSFYSYPQWTISETIPAGTLAHNSRIYNHYFNY